MTERIGGIVLAGGRSARFGRDKLVEPVGGRPMLHLAVDAVRAVATDVTVVVAPHAPDASDPVPHLPVGVAIARDDRAFEGPLAGLATGLDALDPALERVIVVGGDMPTIVPPVLLAMLDRLDRHEAVVLADDDRPRPLPLAVRRGVAAHGAARLLATGERRLRTLLEELEVEVLTPPTWRALDPEGATLRDVDVPADLPPGG